MLEFTSSFSLEVSNESRYDSEISSTVVHVNTLISSPPSIRRWRVLHLVTIVFFVSFGVGRKLERRFAAPGLQFCHSECEAR